jgi:hypothetical protein
MRAGKMIYPIILPLIILPVLGFAGLGSDSGARNAAEA